MNKSKIQSIFQHRLAAPLRGVGLFLRWYYFVVGSLFLIGGLYSLFFSESGFVFWLWALAAAHLGLGVWTILDERNSQICARLMLDALDNDGADLAWVYRVYQVLPNGGYQAVQFAFWFTNRRHDSISLDENEVEEMLNFFKNLSPSISMGYSKELHKRYRQSPGGLKTQPQRVHSALVIEVDPAQSNGW